MGSTVRYTLSICFKRVGWQLKLLALPSVASAEIKREKGELKTHGLEAVR